MSTNAFRSTDLQASLRACLSVALPALKAVHRAIRTEDIIPNGTGSRPINSSTGALAATITPDSAVGALVRADGALGTSVPFAADVVGGVLLAVPPVVLGTPVDAGAASGDRVAETVVRAVVGVRSLVQGMVFWRNGAIVGATEAGDGGGGQGGECED